MSTDVLSDVLSAVRLAGAVFYDVSAKSPWVAEAPPAARIANEVTPGAQHAIEYHVVTRGSCWISIVDRGAFERVGFEPVLFVSSACPVETGSSAVSGTGGSAAEASSSEGLGGAAGSARPRSGAAA